MNFRRRKRAMRHAEAHADGGSPSAPRTMEHQLVAQSEPELLTTAPEIEAFVAHAREEGAVAFDTEFIGEETFHPRICLIQLATTKRVALLDPFELAESDLAPVWKLVCAGDCTTIVHAGGQDVQAAERATGTTCANVVDTQIAAAFLGMAWPASLGSVVHGVTNHRLNKAHTFTEWDSRPLSRSQLAYAADDVRYLPLVWSLQRAQLERNGRLAWVLAESTEHLRTSEAFNPESQVRRAARGLGLRPRIMTILRELVVLRYELARTRDIPPRTVIPDGPLLELARSRYTRPSELFEVRGLSRQVVDDHGSDILRTIDTARNLPLDRDRIWTPPEESAEDRIRIDALWSILTMRCISTGVSTSLALTRSELSRWYLSKERAEGRPLFAVGTWRAEAIGCWLDAFLRGTERLTLAWRDEGPVVP
jgi:ribonuclease D